MAEVSRPVLLRTAQKLRQNRKQVVMAHLKTSINGDGTKYSILDLKQQDQVSHKGTCSPALCQPVHWALLHIPASEVWAPPTSSCTCFLPPSSVTGTYFATASCSMEVDTERPGPHPTQVSSAHLWAHLNSFHRWKPPLPTQGYIQGSNLFKVCSQGASARTQRANNQSIRFTSVISFFLRKA